MARGPGTPPRPFAWMQSLFFGPESREPRSDAPVGAGARAPRPAPRIPELTMLEWGGGTSANDPVHGGPLPK